MGWSNVDRSARVVVPHLKQLVKVAVNHRGLRSFFLRLEVFDLVGRFSPAVAVDLGDVWYYVATTDSQLGRVVFGQGHYEQEVMACAFQILEATSGRVPFLADRVFVDIGANVGTSTIPAIKVFGAARAVVFEPELRNYKLLRCNLIANDLDDRVQTFRLALSDRASLGVLELAEASWGDHRIRRRPDVADGRYAESQRPTVEVELARLDDLDLDLDALGVVWMDTQGHEGHVLAGASRLLDSDVPVVIEYWPYALERAGGLGLLWDLVAQHYRRVVDVRASMRSGRTVELPAADLRRLDIADLAVGLPGERYTDLILLK